MSEKPTLKPDPKSVIKDDVGSALGKIPSGLFILSLIDDTGADDFMLASWVQQCSFSPLMVNIAVRSDRSLLSQLLPGKIFNLHIIKEGQNQIVGRFAKPVPGADLLKDLNLRREPGLPVVLLDTCAVLQCKAASLLSGGDHQLLLAEVVSGNMLAGGDPMVHVRKNARNY
ncbi:MAG: flavin reductase [Planctomycetes bacterium]|nr:flavin reductase [Planctomycetota bacterium]NBY03632.1 flavin reductase [Planctomycetota bacterium]